MKYPRHFAAPEEVDIKLVDGIFMKRIMMRHAGMIIAQHAHSYRHMSHISSGAVRVEADGKVIGDYEAPATIVIEACVKHLFTTLKENTVILCIHNVDRSDGEVAIHEEHRLEFAEDY